MPTSATGRAEAGFTLVELLIVLTIMGLLAASVVLALPDGRASLRAEAEGFAALAKAAKDKAVIDGRPLSLRVTPEGYAFAERRRGEWRPLSREPFGDRSWSEGTALAGEAQRLVFDPTGLVEPASLILVREEDQVRVTVSADGTIGIDD